MNDTHTAQALIKALRQYEQAAYEFGDAFREHFVSSCRDLDMALAQARGMRDGYRIGEMKRYADCATEAVGVPETPVEPPSPTTCGSRDGEMPSAERLAALETLAQEDPTGGRYDGECPYCHADTTHAESCPWLLAQKPEDPPSE